MPSSFHSCCCLIKIVINDFLHGVMFNIAVCHDDTTYVMICGNSLSQLVELNLTFKTLDCGRRWVVTSTFGKTIYLKNVIILVVIFIGCVIYVTIPKFYKDVNVSGFFSVQLDSRKLCLQSVSVEFWSEWLSVSFSYQLSIIYFFFLATAYLFAAVRSFMEWILIKKKC